VNADVFMSTTSTGSSPITVNSTTKVSNLNVDMLDGAHADTAAVVNTIAQRDASGNLVVTDTYYYGSAATSKYNSTTKSIDFIIV